MVMVRNVSIVSMFLYIDLYKFYIYGYGKEREYCVNVPVYRSI